MSRFLLYWSGGRPTGERLGETLGIEHGESLPDRRYDHVIRWGSTRRIRYIPNVRTWNQRNAIRRNSNKLNSLQVLANRGLRVPKFSSTPRELNYPMLGRSINHMQGRDVQLYLQSRDMTFLGEKDYYVEYIPKRKEYRAHVIQNHITIVYEKTCRPNVDEYDQVTCSNNSHWSQRQAETIHPDVYLSIPAVKSLGLDFGAVDLILGEDGNIYFLEVNTSPGLDGERSFNLYVETFRSMLELDN